jgi:sulfatase maturation enzyme AslB (radical SAM superfamily)
MLLTLVEKLKETNMSKFTGRTIAVEIVNAGKCNMNCAYCYIPKSKQMESLHEDVIKYLESGKWIDDIEEMYGDTLECLSPWGTEPTLTVDIFARWMPELVKRFPNFNSVQFSSNFMRHPKYALELVDSLPKDKRFDLSIQYSLDGPAWITDVSRHKNATTRIQNNVLYFMEEMTKRDLGMLRPRMNCKPTWDETIIQMVGKDLSLLEDYLEFFDDFFQRIDEVVLGTQLIHNKVQAPFLGLPGQYSKEDGVHWANITRKLLEEQHLHRTQGKYPYLSRAFCGYLPRLQRILDFGKEYYSKPEMFTCAAGDSQFAIDHKGHLHSCHRTFYLNDDKYVDSIKDTNTAESGNWDYEHYKSDRLGDIRSNMMAKIGDDNAFHRFVYANSSHHYFIQNRVTIYSALVKTMAAAGQINDIYYDDIMARFVSEFMATAYNCNIEYNLTLGSMSLIPAGLLRLTCNGAFELLVEAATGGWDRSIDEWWKV